MEPRDTSILTPAEFSRLSGLSLGYVYARLSSGRVAGAQKIDGQWQVPKAALESLKQRREQLRILAALVGLEWKPLRKVADAYADAFALYPGAVSRLEAIKFIGEKEAERRRQTVALEKARSVDDPIISELIESFRRELAELEAWNKELESGEDPRPRTDANG